MPRRGSQRESSGANYPRTLPVDPRARWLLRWVWVMMLVRRCGVGGWAGPKGTLEATPIYERFVPADKLEETLHSFDGFHPLGRTGTARDLANSITFLLSPATSWSPAPSGTSTAGRN